VETWPDSDGKVRRVFLVNLLPGGQEFVFSFSFLLAREYLESEDIFLKQDLLESEFERIGDTQLPYFVSNTGGYSNVRDFGVQLLLNFRNTRGKERFRTLSFRDIKNRNFDPDWIRDRIVIIGMTATSTPDFIDTVAIADLEIPGKIRGVEFHAHATSQIISAVSDGRPLLDGWSETGEYLWIFAWAIFTIYISLSMRSSSQKLIAIGSAIFILFILSYCLLLIGWWIPVVPVLLIPISGLILTSAVTDRRNLQYEILQENRLSRERKDSIDNAFNHIHNGPLQTLHILLTKVRNNTLTREELMCELERVDREIRKLDETLTRDALSAYETLILGNGTKVDLNLSFHELLAEVYRETIKRDFPNFKTLKITIPQFDEIEAIELNFEEKRKVCQFLEEALCNVGKHAKDATRLAVICKKEGKYCTILLRDNGKPCKIRNSGGKGTRQMRDITGILQGEFKLNISPNGSECKLKLPLEKRNLGFASIKRVLRTLI
ncbi:MAG: CHASE2 domain-containing protein, partial [Cyanobacteria bacterium P01_E01_bin.42]